MTTDTVACLLAIAYLSRGYDSRVYHWWANILIFVLCAGCMDVALHVLH